MFGLEKEEAAVLPQHIFVVMPEEKQDKIRTMIELCLKFGLPIPKELTNEWNASQTWE